MKALTSSEKTALTNLAATLPKGSEERRRVLGLLSKAAKRVSGRVWVDRKGLALGFDRPIKLSEPLVAVSVLGLTAEDLRSAADILDGLGSNSAGYSATFLVGS